MINIPECEKCGPLLEVSFKWTLKVQARTSTVMTRYDGTCQFRSYMDRVPTSTASITEVLAVQPQCPWCDSVIDVEKFGWAVTERDGLWELVPADKLMESIL